MGEVFVDELRPPPGIDEMIEAHTWYPLSLYEVENLRNLALILSRDGKTDTHLDALIDAVADTLHGLFEGALHSPEPVVDLLHPVKTDTHIGKADLTENTSLFSCYHRAVRRYDRAHPPANGMFQEFGKVFSQKGFAARYEENRRAEGGEIVNQPFSLLCGQFIRILYILRTGIAVYASQIAAPGSVPDNNGFFVSGKLKEVRGEFPRIASVTYNVGGFHSSAV